MVKDERGWVNLPLALLLLAAAAAAFGLWGLMHHWRGLALRQLELDACVAREARLMRELLVGVATSNRRLAIERAAGARPAALVEAGAQEALRARWRVAGAAWLGRATCGSWRSPWPGDPWRRDPPDPLGPGLLRWIGGAYRFRVATRGRLRGAAAEVSSDDGLSWKLAWASPH